jgi:pimeloyl-ACP methyl ester carboxylesterase
MDSTFTATHRGGSGPPMVCLHGFTDTWRTWELVLPSLERHHDVLAPTLAGHAGGPALPEEVDGDTAADLVEEAMDAAGFATAHLVGNSLGGYLALQLAARGRARSVVALAPAGGWAAGDESFRAVLDHFPQMKAQVAAAAPRAEAIVSTEKGRRRSTASTTTNYMHIPASLLAHQLRGVAACDAVEPMTALAHEQGWVLDPAKVDCPLRFVWGTADQLLTWPAAAERYRRWFPTADWIELDGIGHAIQLDVPLEAAQLILGFTAGAARHDVPSAG